MRHLRIGEAASLLNASPNTLRSWERRFGFPRPLRSAGQHRLYARAEIEALRVALQQGLHISSAISMAQEGLGADVDALVGALQSFDMTQADRTMDAALALRPVEQAIEDVLLRAVDDLVERQTVDSAAWAFAARWAEQWLARMRRLVPPPARPTSVLIGDASGHPVNPEALYASALELVLARAGTHVALLPAHVVNGLADALRSHPPTIVVIAGRGLNDDAVGRWAFAVRGAVGPTPLVLYRRRTARTAPSTTQPVVLPDAPAAASAAILDRANATASRLGAPV